MGEGEDGLIDQYKKSTWERRGIVQDDHLSGIQRGLLCRVDRLWDRLGRPAVLRSRRLPPTRRRNLTRRRVEGPFGG